MCDILINITAKPKSSWNTINQITELNEPWLNVGIIKRQWLRRPYWAVLWRDASKVSNVFQAVKLTRLGHQSTPRDG